jgi:hypothetical protein
MSPSRIAFETIIQPGRRIHRMRGHTKNESSNQRANREGSFGGRKQTSRGLQGSPVTLLRKVQIL